MDPVRLEVTPYERENAWQADAIGHIEAKLIAEVGAERCHRSRCSYNVDKRDALLVMRCDSASKLSRLHTDHADETEGRTNQKPRAI